MGNRVSKKLQIKFNFCFSLWQKTIKTIFAYEKFLEKNIKTSRLFLTLSEHLNTTEGT